MPTPQETFDAQVANLNEATTALGTRIQELINNIANLSEQEIIDGLQPIANTLNGLAQPGTDGKLVTTVS